MGKRGRKRGLTNIKTVPDALEAYNRPEFKEMFMKLEIFNESEIHGRVEVEYEKFIMKIQIESRVLADMSLNHIVPIAIEYQTMLLENVKNMKKFLPPKNLKILLRAELSISKILEVIFYPYNHFKRR